MNFQLLGDYAIRIGISFICGLCLGIERKSRQHSVGIRTLVLISVTSCLLSILSIYMADTTEVPGDPTRIAAGVVTGIGFIGGGAIMRHGLNIRGITTAAIIFTAAGLGLACGAALYGPVAITMLVVAIVLFMMNKIEKKIFPAAKSKLCEIIFSSRKIPQEKISQIMQKHGFIIHDMNIEYQAEEKHTRLVFTTKAPDELNLMEFTKEVEKLENIISFKLSDQAGEA